MPSTCEIEVLENLGKEVREMLRAPEIAADEGHSFALRNMKAKIGGAVQLYRGLEPGLDKAFVQVTALQEVVQYPETRAFLRGVTESVDVPHVAREAADKIVRSADEEPPGKGRKPTATVDWFTGSLESLGEKEGFAYLVYEDGTEYNSWLNADKLRAAGLRPGDRFFLIMTEDNGRHEIRLIKRPPRYTPQQRENIMQDILARARALLRPPEATDAQPGPDGGQPVAPPT